MANQLGMAEQHSIITLWKRGWSYRRIARTLGVNRETVSRYVRLASERTDEAHGPPASAEAKPATGLNAARSRCDSGAGVCR
jgi:IS30 family transposase